MGEGSKVSLLEGAEIKKSACYFCHNNCGLNAYVKNGKVVKVEGDDNYPINNGGLCSRGNMNFKFHDHPDRINYPLKRVGKRGDGNYERITWDQALDEIAGKLTRIKSEFGAEALATAGGTLRTDDWARRRFMNLYGSPNGFHNAHLCWIPTFMIETAIYGWCPFEPDLANSRCAVMWGHNPGASAMPEMRHFSDFQKKGMKLIVVDPRYTETASKADIWLPLRPGSDIALALAWLNVIIWEGLYNQEFLDNCCTGFDELAQHVAEYTPEWAASKTWLDPEQIRESARMYATNTPGNIVWGVALDQSGKSGGVATHARALLRAVTGNIDAPGSDLMGGPAQDFITDEEMEANDLLPEEQKLKQLGADKFPLLTWPGYGKIAAITKQVWGKAPTAEWMCEAHPPTVWEAITTGKPYPVKGLISLATNPLNSYGDSKKVLAALRAVDFHVSVEYWMTPSAGLADYILPAASALERPIITSTYGCADFLLASQRAVQPMYERHDDFTFWRELSLRMGHGKENWPWKNLEEANFYRIQSLGYEVNSYDEFVEKQRFHFPEREYYKYGSVGFATPSGKIELASSTLADLGFSAMPTYQTPVENEDDDPELAKEFPLVLTTGGGVMPFHHSEFFNIKELRFLRPEPHMLINNETAAELGIEKEDWVWIETKRGRIKQKADVSPAIHPRVIFTERGWWYPERGAKDPDLGGVLESNCNVLTSTEDKDCDQYGGSWANRGLLCKVYKVTEANTKGGL
ncbi:Anaerobic selenocysteine-containing dehydrogenase [Desulfuromusa kysingii]|uniref:Anaerobic selenocysteine-containing dehydrogenase n=1 Tax=Desulfuromusa kysingii TaxID=37625 RepID=A0A1H4A2G1_9BACT|nr:molybdopterin-dependent oxidoreductase [Desulfuromusa kysingii]SEA30229.1 Anaerobic selenocysteine-containing dehydrogenase [Desulfuromusa kysingii]